MGSAADRGRSRFRDVFGSWRALRWPAAVGAWLVIGLIAVTGLVSAADPGSRHLRVTREVSGTVTIVNYNAAKFCLDTDVTREQFCSVSYQPPGSAPLVVGEHVTGTVALLSIGPSESDEVFILTDPRLSHRSAQQGGTDRLDQAALSLKDGQQACLGRAVA